MTDRMTATLLGAAFTVALATSGCVSVRELAGYPAESSPSVSQETAEPRWVLIKNPRFGDVPSEPEYIWVEEDKIPLTWRRMVFGKRSMLAPPEIVAKYGSPPGGGRISPFQGMPAPASPPAGPLSAPPKAAAARRGAEGTGVASNAAPAPVGGYVVYVDTNRVVIDLTARDGIRPGSLVSLRRDKIPIIHPVTGELLGELDEEVATAKVVEVRERFSVAEIQSINPGTQIKVKDRVVPR